MKIAIVGLSGLCLAAVCLIAISERGARSPSSLIEDGKTKLYPYPYYYPYGG